MAPGSDLPYQPKPIETPVPDGVNWFREALPIDIRILNGSVILGSDATPMVLIGDFKGAEGVLSVSDVSLMARSQLNGSVQISLRSVQGIHGDQV